MAKKTEYAIHITGNPPEGVDEPWFELSKSAGDKVTWINDTSAQCTIDFGNDSPFSWPSVQVPGNGGSSGPHTVRANYLIPGNYPPGKVYKLHKYTVTGAAFTFDPGGGVTP